MWISKIVGFASSGPAKLIIIAGVITALTAFRMWDYANIYEAGFNEAALEFRSELSDQLAEEVAKARAEWKIESDRALALVEKERVVVEKTKTIYRDVYKTEYSCKDIGVNALELLNRSLTAPIKEVYDE